MFADLVLNPTAGGEAFVSPIASASWPSLREMTSGAIARLESVKGQRVAVVCAPVAETFAVLAALDAHGAQAVLLDDEIGTEGAVAASLQEMAVARPAAGSIEITTPREAGPTVQQGSIVILTSGTTGEPKSIERTWASLAADVRLAANSHGMRWASAYRLRLFASLQVLLHAWVGEGVFITGASGSAADVATFWRDARPESAGGTPSFWRWLVLGTDPALLAAIPLRQITLGGEPVDQALLDRLRQLYPRARLTHIYATTETGRCIAVSDGKAGFPAALIGAPSEVDIAIDAGELLIRRGEQDPWTHTGDLVRIDGDRVYFDGRADDVLNIGGQKVAPVQVETVIRRMPGVADVRVYGRRSSLSGQIVACEIVPAPGTDPDVLRAAVDVFARSNLTPAQQPRLVEIVAALDMSPAGKAVRQGTTLQ